MPYGWPAFGPPPYEMTSAKMIIVQFEADEGAMRMEVPEPMELLPGHPMFAWVADMRECSLTHSGGPGVYHEGLVGMYVQCKDEQGSEHRGIYVPYIWTSGDEAMLVGRIYGFPKMICERTPLIEEGNQVWGVLRRREDNLIRASVNIERRAVLEDLPFAKGTTDTHLQWRLEPSATPDGRPRVEQVYGVEYGDLKASELWAGKASLEFGNSAHCGIHRLQPTKVVRGWFGTLSWKLLAGKLIWQKIE